MTVRQRGKPQPLNTMNRIALALLATAAIAATSVRAESRVSFGISFGFPIFAPAPPAVIYAPAPPAVVYAPPPAVVYAPPPAVVYVRPAPAPWGYPVRVAPPGYYPYAGRARVGVGYYGYAPAPVYGHPHHGHGRR